MPTPAPRPTAPAAGPPPAAPDLTPAPSLLRALAAVAEVDLATGLGHQRLAQVVRDGGPADLRPRRLPRGLSTALLLLAAVGVLLLALR